MTKKPPQTPTACGEAAAPTPRKGRAIRLKTMDDVRVEMAHVYTDARQKRLEPEKATKLIYILSQIGTVIEGTDLAKRIAELERRA